MNTNDVDILNFLQEACQQIKSFEALAKQALIENNTPRYKELMLEKAKFLATLSMKAQEKLSLLTPDLKDIVEPELQNFSSSALNSISLNSTFYMSALLFPENHIDGNLNNLEKLTLQIENMLK